MLSLFPILDTSALSLGKWEYYHQELFKLLLENWFTNIYYLYNNNKFYFLFVLHANSSAAFWSGSAVPV